MTQEASIGDTIRQARERLGWTQSQLADKIGVTASFVTKVEKNEAVPSYDRLLALANVLVLDSDRLLDLSEQVKQERIQQRLRTRGAVARSPHWAEPRGPAAGKVPGSTATNVAEQLGREILDDSDLQLAFTWLRAIFANPELKSAVLKTLEAFARQANKSGG
jgi:transcriptional regulator with XRE-family HTH domain